MKTNMRFAMCAVLAVATITLAFRAIADDPAPTPGMIIYSGVLRSIDLKARTVIVDGSAIPQKFVVPTDAEIIVKDKPKGALDDLLVGDGVQVKYTDDDGTHVAHQISILGLKVP
jgi:hypothetical protein